MRRIILSLLVISTSANVVLFWQLWRQAETRTKEPVALLAQPAEASSSSNQTGVPVLVATGIGDLSHLRDRLRAAGADVPTTRGVIEGILHRRYRERISPIRLNRERTAWWRDTALALPGTPPPTIEEERLLKEMVSDPLKRLFGTDELELVEREARYEFLPPEKRRLLAAVDRDYSEMRFQLLQSTTGEVPLQRELNQLRILADEKRKDVLAALTPAERTEYDLRFSIEAYSLRQRFELTAGAEEDYRAVYPIIKSYNDRLAASVQNGGVGRSP